MNWKVCEGTQSWCNLSYYVGMYLQGLKTTMKGVSLESCVLNSKLEPTEYKPGMKPT
jgi:hypothetical protein